jgi:hypothetical protein
VARVAAGGVTRRPAAALVAQRLRAGGGMRVAGSVPGSRAWVYHEAALWAVALTMVRLVPVALPDQPSGRDLAGATITTALALQSQSSVGCSASWLSAASRRSTRA